MDDEKWDEPLRVFGQTALELAKAGVEDIALTTDNGLVIDIKITLAGTVPIHEDPTNG